MLRKESVFMGNSDVINLLSYTEVKGAKAVFKELGNQSGVIVCERVAFDLNIARSSIVNALIKLMIAGVVETKSLGRKGTYIEILNHDLVIALGEAKF
jgi:transcriptional pleiotropic repressor